MPNLVNAESLAALNPALQACAESTQVELLGRGQVRAFADGVTLFADGERTAVALFPLEGALQMVKATARGRRQIICTPSCASCGGLCLLAFGDHSLADVRGFRTGSVLIVGREIFQALMHHDHALCRVACNSAATCMAHLAGLVRQLSFTKVAERVRVALLDATMSNGDVVRITQADLAAEVGTTREVVARCLGALQAARAIHLGRGQIRVLSREMLAGPS